jgi:hypothetical protein
MAREARGTWCGRVKRWSSGRRPVPGGSWDFVAAGRGPDRRWLGRRNRARPRPRTHWPVKSVQLPALLAMCRVRDDRQTAPYME